MQASCQKFCLTPTRYHANINPMLISEDVLMNVSLETLSSFISILEKISFDSMSNNELANYLAANRIYFARKKFS